MPAIPYSKTAFTNTPWDAQANIKRLPNDANTLRQEFAWVDDSKDPTTKEAYKLPHHEVSKDGKVGAANIRGCQSAIAVLNGAMGGVDIPDKDREKVYEHLAQHLKDANIVPTILAKDTSCVYKNDIAPISVQFEIMKANNEEGLVSGWANVALQSNGEPPLDWQDDIILPQELERAAIDFMINYRESGENHQGEAKGVVVESIVFTKEKQKAIGIPEGSIPEGWFITVKVLDPSVFEKVKNGTYKMFSIQGSAKRIRL